jgi:hypothetical protein
MQIEALRKAQQFVYDELDPSKISGMATSADTQRLKDRLALQAITDPALSALRYSASGNLLNQANAIGTGVQEQLGQTAAQEILASGSQTQDLRDRLISQAKTELDLGATLPPDVQAELVKAGLERSGMVTGAASPRGIGGTLLRQQIGSGALALQADRQARASAMSAQASQLEAQRQAILGSLFPNLNNMQLSNMGATQAALGTSNTMVPEAGLGGTDIANLWMARVGATNQLQQSAADAAARGAAASGQIWGQAVGNVGQQLSNTNWGNTYNTVKGWFSSPQTSQAPASSGGGGGYTSGWTQDDYNAAIALFGG